MQQVIPILRPKLPDATQLAGYLATIDGSQTYSNFGELHERLRASIAENYSTTPGHVALVSSCTGALLSLLLDHCVTSEKSQSEVKVLVPGWSFVATVQVPLTLGMQVYFGEIDMSGALNFENAEALCRQHGIDVVILVAPFGRKLDYEFWIEFARRLGVSVIVDAAAGFYSVGCSALPTAVSMHATKVFSTGEGGFILSSDTGLIERLDAIANFGLKGARVPKSIGLNFKLSEYACAVGLASVDTHEHRRDQYSGQLEIYAEAFESSSTLDFFGDFTPRTTMNVLVSEAVGSVDKLISELANEHSIQSRRWWGEPLYRHQNSLGLPINSGTELNNCEVLADRVLGIPLGLDLSASTLKRVAGGVQRATETCLRRST